MCDIYSKEIDIKKQESDYLLKETGVVIEKKHMKDFWGAGNTLFPNLGGFHESFFIIIYYTINAYLGKFLYALSFIIKNSEVIRNTLKI